MINRVFPSALLLIRTPFQAWQVTNILKSESVKTYDILYFTHNDSREDQFYFRRLSEKSRTAKYCHAPVRRYDILGHLQWYLQTRKWMSGMRYDLVVLASIDSHVINAIASRQGHAALVTFDDGTANIYRSSNYFIDRLAGRAGIYRHLLGASDLENLKARIVRHYTMYPGFANIVEPERLCSIPGLLRQRDLEGGKIRTYFVGQPFREMFDAVFVKALQEHVRQLPIDAYVRHPRETEPLDIGVPFLDKAGLIAEEAILRDAGNCGISLVGGFSSVMFNLAGVARNMTGILPKRDPRKVELGNLLEQTGGEVFYL